MGIVAAHAHQKGRRKSATNPSRMNVIQKIFRSISKRFYFAVSTFSRSVL
jgi:hypothetical protein